MSNSDEELLAGMPKTGLIDRLKKEANDLDRWSHEGGPNMAETAGLIDEAITDLQEQEQYTVCDDDCPYLDVIPPSPAKVITDLQAHISILESEATHKDTELIKAVAAKRECAIAQMENPIIRFTLSEINQVLTALRDRETYTTEPTVNTGGKGQVLIEEMQAKIDRLINEGVQQVNHIEELIDKIEQYEQALESAKKMLQLQPMGSYDDQCWINGVAVSIDAELERIRKL